MVVTGIGELENIKEFNLVKKKNNHSKCEFVVSAADIVEKELLGKQVKIWNETRAGETLCANNLLMIGKIVEVKEKYGFSENLVYVTAMSFSLWEDQQKYRRIFQSTKQTYRSICSYLEDNNELEISFSSGEYGVDIIDAIEVQNDISNFEYIIEIAKKMKLSCWVNDLVEEKVEFVIGKSKDNSKIVTVNDEDFVNCEKIVKQMEEHLIIQLSDQSKELQRSIDIGSLIAIALENKEKQYVIEEMKVFKKNQVYRYEIVANNVKENNELPQIQSECIMYSGIVTDNKDPENRGRVQIDFNTNLVEDCFKENRNWIDVSTSYEAENGGFLFIPEINDKVDVLWNGIEFLAIGNRRKNEIRDELKNIDDKCISDLSGRIIRFNKDYLEIKSDQNRIYIDNEKIVLSCQDTKVSLVSGKVEVNVEETKAEVTKNIAVKTNTLHCDIGKNLENKVSDEIIFESGKKTKITSSDNVVVSGKKILMN